MADVSHIITRGIGTPGDIPHFVLDGLSPNPRVITLRIPLIGSRGVSISLSGVRTTSMSIVGSDTSSFNLKGS